MAQWHNDILTFPIMPFTLSFMGYIIRFVESLQARFHHAEECSINDAVVAELRMMDRRHLLKLRDSALDLYAGVELEIQRRSGDLD